MFQSLVEEVRCYMEKQEQDNAGKKALRVQIGKFAGMGSSDPKQKRKTMMKTIHGMRKRQGLDSDAE